MQTHPSAWSSYLGSMSSMEPLPDRCAAQTRDGGYCENYPVRGASRCRMHGGTNPGANELNTNAVTHGASMDLDRLEARLDEATREQVAEWTAVIQERSNPSDEDVDVDEKARELALRLVQEHHVQNWLLDETSESTPVSLGPALEIENKIQSLGRDIGLWS